MQENPKTRGVKKIAMLRPASGTRASMQENHRDALGISGLLDPKPLAVPQKLMDPNWTLAFIKLAHTHDPTIPKAQKKGPEGPFFAVGMA